MDKATFTLADTYKACADKAKKASEAKAAAIKKAQDDYEAGQKRIQDATMVEVAALQALKKAGEAAGLIDAAIPMGIRQPLDNAKSELRQHGGGLERAQNQLRHQQEHHDKSIEKVKKLPDTLTDGKTANHTKAYQLRELDDALAQAKIRVESEKSRLAELEERVSAAQAAQDAWFKAARDAAFAEPKKAPEKKSEKEPVKL